ncbi:RNA polymerase, sigma-24 subunit, ECF subfamily [uncultured Paludibacter sp.]|nr:RNA polymerase, sigma-24 subunit, ECF subfamily [uncultured Paludibacter sp.]
MDAREFNALFSTLSDKLFRMAKSMLQNTDEAKDAVQDLQLKLWEKRETLDYAENKFTFTLKTMRNLCIDTLRKKHYSENLPQEMEHHAPTPTQQLEIRDMANYASSLIDKLPEIQRTVMRMRDVEEMEIAEIAYITELSENAVCVNLSRARAKIRTQLLKELQTRN